MKNLLYLSDDRTVFIGRFSQPLQKQLSAASTFIVSTNGAIELIDHQSGDIVRGTSFLIPVGSEVRINTNDAILAYVFLDALGVDLATLIPKMSKPYNMRNNTKIYSGYRGELNVVEQTLDIWNAPPSAKEVFKLSQDWIGFPLPDTLILADSRVEKAVLLIKENYADNISVRDIAEQVNLSEPRLMQLFKQIVGISIRRYRLWHRIYVTAVKMESGLSVTEAALEVGFSDCAQFSRAFKEIGGLKPSDILSITSNTDIRLLNG